MKFGIKEILTTLLVLPVVYGCTTVKQNNFLSGLEIMKRVGMARDPRGKLKTINTQIIRARVESSDTHSKGFMKIRAKRGNKFRIDMHLKGGIVLAKAYDGKHGWRFSSQTGEKLLTGRKLDELRFMAAFFNPGGNRIKLFKSIELMGTEKVMGRDCYKLLCVPKDEYKTLPLILYVDKKTFLVVRRIDQTRTDKGHKIPICYVLTDYRNCDGIMVPWMVVSNVLGNITEFDVQSVEWNKKIDDSIFLPPEQLK